MSDQPDKSTEYEPPSGDGDVDVSPRMIAEGVKDLMYVLDARSIKLGDAVASIYRTMERVRRQEASKNG